MKKYLGSKLKQIFVCGLILFGLINVSLTKGSVYYNVNDYGIIGDSTSLITKKINNLIVKANNEGGGTIYFPAGTYLTGPLTLLSNITLFLDEGSKLKFSDDFDLYLPMVESRFEGVDVMSFHPLIYAYRAKNIAIKGSGIIEGQGRKWWLKHFELEKNYPNVSTKYQKEFLRLNEGMIMPDTPFMFEYGFCRPPLFQTMYCEDVRLEGVTFQNSPFWTINPEFSNNITITGIKVVNPDGPNTDGINPESCKNVHISDCHISVGDDCITIKSGKDLPGRIKGIPCENITITNCTMLAGHGGVVIGSEMSGDVRNVVISNCVFDGIDRGIRIKSTRGRGGVVENIRVSNLVMRNVKSEAIKLNLFYSKTNPEPVSERTPQFRNIHFSNISGDAKQAIVIIGLPEMPVRDISFIDINLISEKGVEISHAEKIVFNQVTINNINGSAIKIEQSSFIDLNGFKTLTTQDNFSIINLVNSNTVFIHNSFQTQKATNFVLVEGEKSHTIRIDNNFLLNVETKLKLSGEVPFSAILKE